MKIPKRTLGRTGFDTTILGLGGEGILRTYGYEKEAYELINRAIDLGITYFESARAYSGSERYYGLALKERRKQIFLTSKSHARDKKGALSHLRETLDNMKTDYLDLWQVHDVRTEYEINLIFRKNGSIEAFSDAKRKGMVRFIGVTGHQKPSVIKKCIEMFDFDTVLIPVNTAEPVYESFIDEVIPVANKKAMGIIAMKIYFRGLVSKIPSPLSPELLFRFALSHPVSAAVIGCDNTKQLDENVRFAKNFRPLGGDDMQKLVRLTSPYSRKLMYYKP